MAAKGGQAAGLAYLFDCEPGKRIRARLAARSGQQFGVLDEAERIPRGTTEPWANSRTGASFTAARSQFKMSYQARFPTGESARSLNRGAPEALDVEPSVAQNVRLCLPARSVFAVSQ
jgi:hypothetical protein